MKSLRLGLLTLGFLVAPTVTQAIVVNDSFGLAGTVDYGAPFTGVVGLYNDGGQFTCTGSLVGSQRDTILTARHCGTNLSYAYFHNTDNNGAFTPRRVVGYESLGPPAGTFAGNDLALLFLEESAPSWAQPFELWNVPSASLVANEFAMVGFGDWGLASTGPANAQNGIRRAAENEIDYYGAGIDSNWGNGSCDEYAGNANLFSADFDSGSAANNTLGDCTQLGHTSLAGQLLREGITARGDSGGPLLLWYDGDWLIAGVLSGGTAGASAGLYGANSWWTATAQHRDWIRQFVVPEPGTFALLGLGLAGLAATRKRKQVIGNA